MDTQYPLRHRFPESDEELPAGVDRRTFLMRSAVVGAAAVSPADRCRPRSRRPKRPPMRRDRSVWPPSCPPSLDVVKKSKGPVMTTLDEFYKVGPGPSSSHTIGPMRITYDFYQRCTKLPQDKLAKATGCKVHLFGSLSSTGKGHGTERAALAGIVGKEPATVEPEFLDGLAANPKQTFPVKLGGKTMNVSLDGHHLRRARRAVPAPNTMTCKLMAGDAVLHELEYYSVGGGFIEWKGYKPPKKGQPKYPYATMAELKAHAEKNKLSIAQVVDGQRDGGLRQEQGRDRGVHRQDHHGDGRTS